MTNNDKGSGIFFPCRAWKFHAFEMRDFPSGAHWPHVPIQMVRAAVAGFNHAARTLGLPYNLEADHGPESGKVIKKLFLVTGDSDPKIVKVQILDFVVMLNERAISVRGEGASERLVSVLIDVLETALMPAPPRRPVGRPRKVRKPVNECPVRRRSYPERRIDFNMKSRPLVRRAASPQRLIKKKKKDGG